MTRGFTLVELMMATAILSVMIALATIGMITMRRQAYVNGETQKLVARLRDARTRAVGLARKHGLYIGGASDPQFPSQVVVFSKTDPDAVSNLPEVADGGVDRILITDRLGDLSGQSTVQITNGIPDGGSLAVTFDGNGAPVVTMVTGGTTATYDWTGGPYMFQLQNTGETAPPRQFIIRSDGTVKVTQ
jgi:prepilin-type N-terminal cleavage/methylation domain-containing protein